MSNPRIIPDAYQVPVTIDVRRVRENIIEYAVTFHDPIGGDETRTYHANREATFFGPHVGSVAARQVNGETLWRDDDTDMLLAFRRAYERRGYTIRKMSLNRTEG